MFIIRYFQWNLNKLIPATHHHVVHLVVAQQQMDVFLALAYLIIEAIHHSVCHPSMHV